MTERTLAASPNLDERQRVRLDGDNETSPNTTQVNYVLFSIFTSSVVDLAFFADVSTRRHNF